MDGATGILGRPTIGIFQPSSGALDRLGAWFETEYPALLRFAYLVCRDHAQAEDLVQDAFVRLWRARNRIQHDTVGAYARRTIVNLSRTSFRRRAMERERSAVPDRGPGPTHDLGERDEVWRAMAALSPRQRAVIALRFYEDMTEQQAAGVLGITVGSVKQHSARALERLHELLSNGRTP